MPEKLKTKSRRTQFERSEASSEAILTATIELFVEYGSGVSLEKIGARAGFSHGLVMSRFGGKDGLIQAVTKRTQNMFIAEITSRSQNQKGMAAIESIAMTVSEAISELSNIGKAFYVLLGESMRPSSRVRPNFLEADIAFRRYIAAQIDVAIEERDLDPTLDVEAAAFLLVGLFRGILTQQMLNSKACKSKKLEMETLKAVRRILGVPAHLNKGCQHAGT